VGLPDYDSIRRNYFVHLRVSYWEGQYKLREMSDSAIRYVAANELFVSDIDRHYWSLTRDIKLKHYKGWLRRCTIIIDEEYQKAVANGPLAARAHRGSLNNETTSTSRQISPMQSGIVVGTAIGAAILAGRLLGRQFFRKPQ
jgi:hypothetical protein